MFTDEHGNVIEFRQHGESFRYDMKPHPYLPKVVVPVISPQEAVYYHPGSYDEGPSAWGLEPPTDRELCDRPTPRRSYTVKTQKIELPFNQEEPLLPILVDVPRSYEIVHVSGYLDNDGMDDGHAFLHVASSDDRPHVEMKATAFFVVPDGMDVPNWLVVTKSRPDGCSYGDEETCVQRVGKFEVDSELFFVFERM